MTTNKNISDSQSKGMTDNIFNNSVEANNKVADNNIESIPANVNEPLTSHVPIEPKQQRIGAKQRKMEYGAYKTRQHSLLLRYLNSENRQASARDCTTA